MSAPLPEKYYVVLERNENGGRLMVDLEAYAKFDLWMEQQIQLLQERFAEYAAPQALLSFRTSKIGESGPG
jgi:hypothetical protein